MTEYFAQKTNSKGEEVMLILIRIQAKPLTTHLPLKRIFKK